MTGAGDDAVEFGEATRAEVADILALLRDDRLGSGREGADMAIYHAAFDAMRAEGNNLLLVGRLHGRVVATYQLTFISGLSLRACRRAQIESVRVASDLRGHRIGEAMIADAEARARAAGCGLLQLTMNTERADARRFYERVGFVASHTGFKREVSAS